MTADRPICVLVAALGGQGGGVLADWLVSAAQIEGFPAQATSTPGVAQRTGATTYYFEVFPHSGVEQRPVFSIYPAPGSVDLQVSFEPTEAARSLSGGFIDPETTLITSTDRIYSTAEKILPGDGTVSLEPILKALKACAGKLTLVDMIGTARMAGCHPNAVMFGVMAASSVLPFSIDTCRNAIEISGVAVKQNLVGFDAGLTLSSRTIENVGPPVPEFSLPSTKFSAQVQALPLPVQQMAGHCVAHLCDYQNAGYAKLYLKRLSEIIASDCAEQSFRLSLSVARRLAAWMAFEDVIRVAQLKTRSGRMSRIRAELGVTDDAPLKVLDYLKPGWEELQGMMPKGMGKLISNQKSGGIALKIRTSAPLGWASMRLLASLRFWRPITTRFAYEQLMIENWLDAVKDMASQDYNLACDMSDLAVWVRGYGETRKRGFDHLTTLFNHRPQLNKNKDHTAFAENVAASLTAAHSNPDAR
jgi:indolepyruvate ferredoxin oxidoreductase, beta subunit